MVISSEQEIQEGKEALALIINQIKKLRFDQTRKLTREIDLQLQNLISDLEELQQSNSTNAAIYARAYINEHKGTYKDFEKNIQIIYSQYDQFYPGILQKTPLFGELITSLYRLLGRIFSKIRNSPSYEERTNQRLQKLVNAFKLEPNPLDLPHVPNAATTLDEDRDLNPEDPEQVEALDRYIKSTQERLERLKISQDPDQALPLHPKSFHQDPELELGVINAQDQPSTPIGVPTTGQITTPPPPLGIPTSPLYPPPPPIGIPTTGQITAPPPPLGTHGNEIPAPPPPLGLPITSRQSSVNEESQSISDFPIHNPISQQLRDQPISRIVVTLPPEEHQAQLQSTNPQPTRPVTPTQATEHYFSKSSQPPEKMQELMRIIRRPQQDTFSQYSLLYDMLQDFKKKHPDCAHIDDVLSYINGIQKTKYSP